MNERKDVCMIKILYIFKWENALKMQSCELKRVCCIFLIKEEIFKVKCKLMTLDDRKQAV